MTHYTVAMEIKQMFTSADRMLGFLFLCEDISLNINFTFNVLSVGYTAHIYIYIYIYIYEGKAFLFQPWTGSLGYRKLRLPEIIESRHMKVV